MMWVNSYMPRQKITREEIIVRSTKVFRKQGYHSTTMNDIGKISGLLKGSIYHYFNSKEELMVAVLQASYEDGCRYIYPIAYDRSLTPQQRLEKILNAVETGLFSNGTNEGGCLFGTIGMEASPHISEFLDVIRSNFDASIAAFTVIFEESVDKDQAENLAKQAHVEMQGAILLSLIYNDTNFFKMAKQRILNYVI